MNKNSLLCVVCSCSDNPKSKIENLKPGWRFAIVLALVLCGADVMAQQPAKIPKIGYLVAGSAPSTVASELFRREFRGLRYEEGKT